MALGHGADITKDQLLLHLDAGNRKSYSGTGTNWNNLTAGKVNSKLGTTTAFSTDGYFQLDATTTSNIQVTDTLGYVDMYYVENNYFEIESNYPITWDQPITFEIFAYFDSDGTWHNGYDGALIAKAKTTGNLGLIRTTTDNTVAMWLKDDVASTTATATITGRNQWNHIVGTWNGIDKIKIYINGVLKTTQVKVASGSISYQDSEIYYIGGMNSTLIGAPGNSMKGRISNLKIYKKELSAAEIQKNFDALRWRYGI